MSDKSYEHARRIGPVYDPELAARLTRKPWEAPHSRSFSCANAWNLLIASYLAYAPKDQAIAELLRHGMTSYNGGIVWVEKENDVAFVASDGQHAIVAARGSDEMRDWWDNLQVGLVDDTMGRVHGGISKAIARVWQHLDSRGLELVSQAKRVWLTGHSRGALMITLVAARWRARGVRLDGLYTFGSPRIGDEKFQAELHASMPGLIHRVQNEGDWMADMPPNPPYRHVHVGELTSTRESDDTEDGATPQEKETRLKLLLNQGITGLRDRIIGHHLPQAYFKGLQEYCEA